MPFYEYKCSDCGKIIEFRSSYEKKKEMETSLKCQICGSKKFTQVFSGISLSGPKGETSVPPMGGCCSGGMCNI